MYVMRKYMTYFIIKLRFAGITQADQAGIEKAPRWPNICNKSFQTKTCSDFFILPLSLSTYIGPKKKKVRAMSLVFVLLDF